ncbi:MAG: protein-L-isoaspartate O-methyltransferase [Pirellulaceae bacterium]|nr:MAG: protein-L-isoaspartate O-methyltransferase [Pirellulaceae bacterium]
MTNDWRSQRRAMRKDLERRGIRDQRVLDAMERVPRELFVPPAEQDLAYSDQALPIDCGQTISQPYMVALMTECLQLTGNERVLEIGTGSGYQTAVLAELAKEVVSIERWPVLSRQAAQRLSSLGYRNVELRVGDGALGAPDRAPFDRILITAAAEQCPPALWEQLAEGGVLVGPFGERDDQWLESRRKIGGKPVVSYHVPCRFVPFVMGKPVPREIVEPPEERTSRESTDNTGPASRSGEQNG